MVEWSENYVTVVGYSNPPHFGLVDKAWLNWRPGGALRWKVEIVDWEGRRVVCGKPAPPRL
jgi:hypothetical protein